MSDRKIGMFLCVVFSVGGMLFGNYGIAITYAILAMVFKKD